MMTTPELTSFAPTAAPKGPLRDPWGARRSWSGPAGAGESPRQAGTMPGATERVR